LKRYFIRLFFCLGLIGLLLAHIAGHVNIPFVREFERLLYDARVRLTAPRGQDAQIIIVALDEESMDAEGHWPWTRDKLAKLVQNLFDYGVIVVGWDVVFPERDLSSDVDLLHEMAERAGDRQFVRQLEVFTPQLNRDHIFSEALATGPSAP
jgi:adenylate cyclase